MYKFEPYVNTQQGLKGGGDDDVGGVLLASALGCVIAIILLVIVAQYTQLPKQICDMLNTPPKPGVALKQQGPVASPKAASPQPQRLLGGNVNNDADRNRQLIDYPSYFKPGYDPDTYAPPPTGPPKKVPKAVSGKSVFAKVNAPRQKFTTGKEPAVHLPGVPRPGKVTGAKEVFSANKAMYDALQNKQLRTRMTNAHHGLEPIYDRQTLPYKTYDPRRRDHYAKIMNKKSRQLRQKGLMSTAFNLPQTFETELTPQERAKTLGQSIDFEDFNIGD